MTTDFISLLPNPPFGTAAPSAAASHAPEPLHATTVFAFHCREGVLAVGDHRATTGNIIFTDQAEKILALDDHSVMAIAGSPAVALEMARLLETTFEFHRRSQLQPLSLPAKVRSVANLLRNNLSGTLQGFGVVVPLFVGWDPATKRTGIYFYDPLGAHFEAAKFAGSGSGSGSIKSILTHLERWGKPRPEDMKLPEAVLLALRLLVTAAVHDSATGGVAPEQNRFATIKLVNGDGIRDITSSEQSEFWAKAK